jgi:hypothetical protein
MATIQLKQKDKRAFRPVPAAHHRPHNIEDNVPFDPQKLLAMHPVIRVFSPSPASLTEKVTKNYIGHKTITSMLQVTNVTNIALSD